MEPSAAIFILFAAFSMILQLEASRPIISHISVMGMVYCDTCSINSFNNQTYLLSGADVRIDCKFNAASPRTAEQISFSVNRTTNQYGVYRLDIPSVDGIYCAREAAVLNTCRATLIRSGVRACDVPGFTTTSDEFSIKSKQANECIYSMFSLSFRPAKKDPAICGN
ncbi:major pollen allergen Pla l 1-like [Bidens hawaiensis]|uniref:major pollen allergen Pla l 1-like n=1 Tax=Bidens hawaiensis TaxID=980011 RepID=UPI004049B7B7